MTTNMTVASITTTAINNCEKRNSKKNMKINHSHNLHNNDNYDGANSNSGHDKNVDDNNKNNKSTYQDKNPNTDNKKNNTNADKKKTNLDVIDS